MSQETNLVVTATGTLVGLIAILVEEREPAGNLSRHRITRRPELLLQARVAEETSDCKAGDPLETEIVADLLNLLSKPARARFLPTVVGGRSSDLV